MDGMAIDRDQMNLRAIGAAVEEARLLRGWGKEKAAREAGISSITLSRIEDGLRVQDAKLAALCTALEIGFNLPGTAPGEVVKVGYFAGEDGVSSVYPHEGEGDVGGPAQDAQQYVESVGERVESGISNEELLREILRSRAEYDQLRAEVREVSKRVEDIEQRSP